MIGFELNVNGQVVSGSVEEGVFSIILTRRVMNQETDSIDLNFTGLDTGDPATHKMIDWYQSQMEIGDEISIKIKKISEISKPIEVRERGNPEEGQSMSCKIK